MDNVLTVVNDLPETEMKELLDRHRIINKGSVITLDDVSRGLELLARENSELINHLKTY